MRDISALVVSQHLSGLLAMGDGLLLMSCVYDAKTCLNQFFDIHGAMGWSYDAMAYNI